MTAMKYAYAVLAAAVIGLAAWWAVGAAPAKPAADVAAADGQRFTQVAPSDYKALADCVVCHSLSPDGPDRSAPSLVGIVGAPVARSDWFAYSPALRKKGGEWSEKTLDAYLKNPTAAVPGTVKTLSPVRADETRREIIAALKALPGS